MARTRHPAAGARSLAASGIADPRFIVRLAAAWTDSIFKLLLGTGLQMVALSRGSTLEPVIEPKAIRWSRFFRRPSSNLTPNKRQAHLRTIYPRSCASAEHRRPESRQHQEKFRELGPQDRRADTGVFSRYVNQNSFGAPRPIDRHDRDLTRRLEVNSAFPLVRLSCHPDLSSSSFLNAV